ncbi:MAG: hypothetical protein HXX16_07940 [Bacteroidales bacterium]|nr:hypothetical protein [Bacteroidales bacterium]
MKKTVCKKNFESIRDAEKFGKKELRKIQGGLARCLTLLSGGEYDGGGDPSSLDV